MTIHIKNIKKNTKNCMKKKTLNYIKLIWFHFTQGEFMYDT